MLLSWNITFSGNLSCFWPIFISFSFKDILSCFICSIVNRHSFSITKWSPFTFIRRYLRHNWKWFQVSSEEKKVIFMPATEKPVRQEHAGQVHHHSHVFSNLSKTEVFWRVKGFVSFSVVMTFSSELSWLNRTVPIVFIAIIFLVCPASHMSFFAPVT